MSKGSSFERDFCDRLSEWWTGEKDRRIFWRSSNSGGMATVRNRKGKKTKHHCGDVCAMDPDGFFLTDCFSFELKRGYNSLSLQDLLDTPEEIKHAAKKSCLPNWFAQAERGREASGALYWLLVIRRDKRVPLVVMPSTLFARLEEYDCDFHSFLEFYSEQKGYVAVTLDLWFREVRPGMVHMLLGREKNAG